MKYNISTPHPVSRFVEIEFIADRLHGEEVIIHLASWRPGRYEMGNFARNIRQWLVFDSSGNPLPFKKISRNSWQVNIKDVSAIVVRYTYYASQADAGACWLDEDQLYLNPIHCMLFIPGRTHEPCQLTFDLPANYTIATSLKKLSDHVLWAADYDELVDSPLIASHSLKQNTYECGGVNFHVWFQGDCVPDWDVILADFRRFSHEQIRMMGDFPTPEYHFLVQALPEKFYHGVEHLKSSMLAIGPGKKLMETELYTDFTGLASHELFHSWNVKTIRPAEMMPYDYSNDNYSRLGFVYEGVTTYYGDLFLVRSGVYTVGQFFKEMENRLKKHYDNFGRFNLSVADSSFDTWLDGYQLGIPNRKTSIYDKGCVIALMTDFLIRKNSESRNSLDDVMKTLYTDFGKKKIGYTEFDYMTIIENLAGKSMADFFIDYVYGTEDEESLLEELLGYAGCELVKKENPCYHECYFGFKIVDKNNAQYAVAIAPGSVAEKAGLGNDDELLAVNEIRVEDNIDELCNHFAGQKIVLTVSTPMKKLKDISLQPSGNEYFQIYSIRQKEKANPDEQRFFKGWLKKEFYP